MEPGTIGLRSIHYPALGPEKPQEVGPTAEAGPDARARGGANLGSGPRVVDSESTSGQREAAYGPAGVERGKGSEGPELGPAMWDQWKAA